jgi:hypothetical protein
LFGERIVNSTTEVRREDQRGKVWYGEGGGKDGQGGRHTEYLGRQRRHSISQQSGEIGVNGK